eukprot:4582887-Prymnesium_polylepis.1
MPGAARIGASGLNDAPPQMAISQRPRRRACSPRTIATSDDAHAACTTSAGPLRPRWYARTEAR